MASVCDRLYYKLAAGWKTALQMDAEPKWTAFPPQYPRGYSNLIYSRQASFAPPASTSQYIRSEARRRALSGVLVEAGLGRAHWDLAYLSYAQLLYLHTQIWSGEYSAVKVTLQMPGYFGAEAALVTAQGYGDFPIPEATLTRGPTRAPGWAGVRLDFVSLREV